MKNSLEQRVAELEKKVAELEGRVPEQQSKIYETSYKSLTIFIEEEVPGTYKAEIADSKERKKLVELKLKRITNKRFKIEDCRFF